MTIPVPLGRMDRPTRDSMTELLPELYNGDICIYMTTYLQKISNYLSPHDYNLRQVNGICPHSVKDILQFINDRNQRLHYGFRFLNWMSFVTDQFCPQLNSVLTSQVVSQVGTQLHCHMVDEGKIESN